MAMMSREEAALALVLLAARDPDQTGRFRTWPLVLTLCLYQKAGAAPGLNQHY
jgi:hypothetical protein